MTTGGNGLSAASESGVGYRPAPRPMVTLPLDEIQWLRDRLGRLRDRSPEIKVLFSQVHALYERACKLSRSQQAASP